MIALWFSEAVYTVVDLFHSIYTLASYVTHGPDIKITTE